MISNEVSKQVLPFHDLLGGLRSRLDSLYRNGDKSLAPGYLDVRREVDDQRWREQVEFKKEISSEIGDLKKQLGDYFLVKTVEAEARTKRTETWTRWLKIIGLVITIAAGSFTIYNVVKTALHVHNTLFTSHSEVYASDQMTSGGEPVEAPDVRIK